MNEHSHPLNVSFSESLQTQCFQGFKALLERNFWKKDCFRSICDDPADWLNEENSLFKGSDIDSIGFFENLENFDRNIKSIRVLVTAYFAGLVVLVHKEYREKGL